MKDFEMGQAGNGAPIMEIDPYGNSPIVPSNPETQVVQPEAEKKDSLSLEVLSPEERQLIENIVSKIDLSTSDGVINYGVGTQSKIAEFCDQILNSIKVNKLDSEVANSLVDLTSEIKNFDFEDDGDSKPGFLSNLFSGFNSGAKKASEGASNLGKQIKNQIILSKKEAEKMLMKYESVEKTIDVIIDRLEKSKNEMLKNINIMDSMYNTNVQYYKELTYILIAAKEKLKSYKEEVNKQKEVAVSSNDQMEIQKYNEMNDIQVKFERKIDDLLRTRLVSIQNAPQIRLVQQGSEQLVYQIQNSIFTAIPVWKSQMVINLGIANNKTALGLQKHITDTTNELLQRNSELLKQGALEIAEEGERGIVSLETLQITNANLIETINGVMDIQKRGKEQRALAEVEIKKLEEQVKQTLLQAQN
jgi:uncharacterized protein YaaN involved in tellurite resistance